MPQKYSAASRKDASLCLVGLCCWPFLVVGFWWWKNKNLFSYTRVSLGRFTSIAFSISSLSMFVLEHNGDSMGLWGKEISSLWAILFVARPDPSLSLCVLFKPCFLGVLSTLLALLLLLLLMFVVGFCLASSTRNLPSHTLSLQQQLFPTSFL
jgi:hypothetical protein